MHSGSRYRTAGSSWKLES